jgi:hypothetical protein
VGYKFYQFNFYQFNFYQFNFYQFNFYPRPFCAIGVDVGARVVQLYAPPLGGGGLHCTTHPRCNGTLCTGFAPAAPGCNPLISLTSWVQTAGK